MISKLGNDAIGDNYMENFADVCMNTANVGRTDDASTGAAAIIVDGDGNNAIAVVMGANNLLTLEDVEAARPTAPPVPVHTPRAARAAVEKAAASRPEKARAPPQMARGAARARATRKSPGLV